MNNQNKKKFDFSNNFENVFKSTDPEAKLKGHSIENINIRNLVSFKNHPFKLYEGERFTDMVNSVRTNGIIIPIIIRPLDEELYEILSGHNRVEAAKSAGLENVPAVVRGDLNDDEALLIVTETNLIQRSFSDLSHSERATSLAVHHDAIKNQGKRTDLINEIENLLKIDENISNNETYETCSPLGNKLKTIEKVGQQYSLSKNSVARYLRINKLINKLKDCVDNEEISIRAAVALSYLSNENQQELAEILFATPELKIDIKKAESLRELSDENKLTSKMIEDILLGISIKKRNRASLPVQSLKIGGKRLSEYFEPEQKPKEIEDELFKALEFYRAHNKESDQKH